jgi:pyrimidine deaminase RibD-like protein
MIITQKLPQGHIYPQLTHAPIASYPDFLNYFRGGHTIDDNLGATSIQNTMQYNFFTTAIASGHLKKLKNMAIPNEFLADIFLTEIGSDFTQLLIDRKFCDMAVEEAKKSITEKDGELHPFVGAVVVKDGKVLGTGFRGETGEGRHAEYCALRKINDDVDHVDLSGCTVYTTLEPCSKRNSSNKTACATRLINAKVSQVVFGMPDKDESVYGHVSLLEANVDVRLFPRDLIQELVALNKKWSDTRRQPEIAPAPSDASPLASVSYYKPGTSMADNIWLYVRPPKNDGGLFTIEDGARTVVAWGKTFDEIAMKWHQIDDQKTIVEKLQRQSSGSSHRLLTLT